MSATQQESEDSGEMSDLLPFLKSLSDVLKEHQKVLPTLPEMCERLLVLTAQTNMPAESYEKSNFDLFREDEKSVLNKRKESDLVKHLKDELAKSEERFSELNKQCEHLYNHCRTQDENYRSNHDKYMAEIRAMEDELKDSRERIVRLESELKSEERMLMTRETPLENKSPLKRSLSTMTDIEGRDGSERFTEKEREYQETISKRDEELKNLQHSFHQMKESLNTGICKKQEELKEAEDRFHRLEEEATSIISRKDEQLNQMKLRQKEFIEKCKARLESKDEELREMKMRLAHLSEKVLKKDQRKVEDTTSSNRPSEVEEDFNGFFDNERMDAIEKMQNIYGSEEDSDIGISYPRLACMIFEAAYEKATEAKNSALRVFKEIINKMIEQAPELGEDYLVSEEKYKLPSHRVTLKISTCSQELKCPTEVLDALLLSLKETAHICSTDSMKEGVRRKVTEKWTSWLASEKSCKFSFSNHLLFELKDYIEACIRLNWRMVVQVPPMQLEYTSTTLKNFHKKVGYHSSPEMVSRPPPNGQTAPKDEIACYLWPAFIDGGGRLIRAGEVLCKVEAEAV